MIPVPPPTKKVTNRENWRLLDVTKSAMALFFFALPHFSIPAGQIYRLPIASIIGVFLVAIIFITPTKKQSRQDQADIRWLLICFILYSVFSVLLGYQVVAAEDKDVLHLTSEDLFYIPVAITRLLQLLLILFVIEAIKKSQLAVDDLMRWWLNGSNCAVALHLLTYFITDDELQQRAGPFTEGNLGGLYYILSTFIALEYRRTGNAKLAQTYMVVSLAGVMMTQSTAAIIIVTIALTMRHCILAESYWTRFGRLVFALGLALILIPVIHRLGLDLGIGEKLFGESINAFSFSRIDRLESINVAMQLFMQSPILGSGLQTYGFLCNELISGPLQEVYDYSHRRIPNNVYFEIAAELGLVGLGFFMAILFKLLRKSMRISNNEKTNLFLGFVSILLYWNAYPTYSVLFVWVFFGLILEHRHERRATLPLNTVHQ